MGASLLSEAQACLLQQLRPRGLLTFAMHFNATQGSIRNGCCAGSEATVGRCGLKLLVKEQLTMCCSHPAGVKSGGLGNVACAQMLQVWQEDGTHITTYLWH
jgi:hypothetical protein